MEGDDEAEIRRASEELAQASHKLAEQLYAQKSGGEQGGQAGPQPGAQAGAQQDGPKKDDDVVDADYTEVK